jgi:DNA-nicking Smr family endonuclease
MRRRTKRAATLPRASRGFHHQPFRRLAGIVREPSPASEPPPVPRDGKIALESAVSEEDLFLREMADVRPLTSKQRAHVPRQPPPLPPKAPTDPDAEALAELSDLVAGNGAFDITQTTEFLEGAVLGLDRRLVRRLRNGEFAYQSHLDLHGMTSEQARAAVDSFLTTAHRRGYRCVLIVHGRGHNSADQVPVLKRKVTAWLSRGSWARLVLAFTSARACDGGAGALYVLLRRRRHKKRPIRVTEGACW